MDIAVNDTGLSQTFNLSDEDFAADDQKYILTGQLLRKICVPIIGTVGICGNILSIVVFLTRYMRRLSCSIFLAGLAFVDNLFLVSLMITWVDGHLANILTSGISCQCIIFVTYVSSFLSVWFIVGFTCERFFAICFPLRAFTCTKFRGKTAVLSLTVLACLSYTFSFYTVTVGRNHSRQICVFRNEYMDFLQTATWIDTIITLVIPFLTITIVNAKILQTFFKSSKRRPIHHPKLRRLSADPRQGRNISSRPIWKRHPSFRITRTVLFVSTTFIVLNLPSHTIRLYNLITYTSNGGGNFTTSVKFLFLQELGNMLFYMTFGCNFILYTLFGSNFRHSLKSLFMCRSYKDAERRRVLWQLQSTQEHNTTSCINASSTKSECDASAIGTG